MKMSVIIPTYRRLTQLQACLSGIAMQTHLPDEVIVVWRDEDSLTGQWLEQWGLETETYEKHALCVTLSGVTFAMSSGLMLATGEVVVFIDDDAVPRQDWLGRILLNYEESRVGGVGGRDVVAHNMESSLSSTAVGQLICYGW